MVLDASAATELLLNTHAGQRLAFRLTETEVIHVPHLIDVEIAQVLRRYVANGRARPRSLARPRCCA